MSQSKMPDKVWVMYSFDYEDKLEVSQHNEKCGDVVYHSEETRQKQIDEAVRVALVNYSENLSIPDAYAAGKREATDEAVNAALDKVIGRVNNYQGYDADYGEFVTVISMLTFINSLKRGDKP